MPQLDKKNSIICIDPNGDLTLVVGPDKVRMQVDAKALRRTSKVFDRMLFGHYMESNRTPKWTVELPVDDPEALEVIFNAAHAYMRKVPPNLELSMFYRVAVMAEKYLMLDWFRPWTSTWKSTIKVKWLQDFYKNGTTYEDLQKLCVMCYFGTVEELKKIVRPLIFNTRTGPNGELLFRMTTDTDGMDLEEDANEEDANEEDANEEDANEEDANEEDANEEDADEEDAAEEEIKKWETFGLLPQYIIGESLSTFIHIPD